MKGELPYLRVGCGAVLLGLVAIQHVLPRKLHGFYKGTRIVIRLMDKILRDLIYLSYGIYGTILYLGHAEFVHQP